VVHAVQGSLPEASVVSTPARAVAVLLQAGLIAVTLVALPYKLFDLDRYFVPKELVLHLVALVAAIAMLIRLRSVQVDLADKLLAFFLVWSTLSAVFATNYWAAQRALGLSVSSAIVFWAARRIAAEGLYRALMNGAAVATVLAAATCLLQAYGLETDLFSLNRAPGGTFGNRNFVAHICAIGLPALAFSVVTARRPGGALAGSVGTAVVAAALVLTRSRAAWLAVACSLAILAVPLLASRKYWNGGLVGGRLARLGLAAVVGACFAIAMPNTLNWNSDSPYLDSARGMVDYSSGSGKGRLAQYTNSLRMAIHHPVFGVGPGNWPVRYVRYAPRGDRSLAENGMTANPWPSSDWVAFFSERGFIACVALLGVFLVLFIGALRRWSHLSGDAVLARVALAGTIVATMVVSAFDAVLLLAAPAFLAWLVIGAGSGIPAATSATLVTVPRPRWTAAVALTLTIVALSLVRSATQIVAISTVGLGGMRAGWFAAAPWDPGSYRINVRVAEFHASRGRCAQARVYARRARALFPDAPAPRQLEQRCR
jgi:O-antigen ligase